jgi:hypothetical protein
MDPNDQLPGEQARHSGEYEERNVLGGVTGWSIYADRGAILPSLPRGFTWRFVTQEPEQSPREVGTTTIRGAMR